MIRFYYHQIKHNLERLWWSWLDYGIMEIEIDGQKTYCAYSNKPILVVGKHTFYE